MDPMDTAPATGQPAVTSDLNVAPSILGELRRARAAIGANAEPIDLPIPGYGGQLIARFRWVPVNDLTATSSSLRAIKNQTDQQLAAAADALVATNEEILVKTDAGFEIVEHGAQPVSFSNGEGLALALGLPKPKSARECVMAVFGNEYAMVDVAGKVLEWLEDTSREVDGAYLGE